MNCEEVALKIPDLVAGRLDQGERIAVEAAIARCPHCVEFRRRIEAFYALDLDSSWQPRPVPMPELPADNRFLVRRAAAAAAALVIALLSIWAFVLKGERDQVRVELEPLAVILPQIPENGGDGLWTQDEDEALLLSAYSGRPLVTAYLFPYCPRSEGMLDDFEQPEAHDILAGFIHRKVTFTESLPEALRVRQHEVSQSMFLHTPVLVISDGQREEEALYDIDNLGMVEARMKRFRKERPAALEKALDAERFERYRGIILGLPELLTNEQWGLALRRLDEALAERERFQSRFFDDFEGLRAALLNQIAARIERAAGEIDRGGQVAEEARARLEAMLEALDGEAPADRIRALLHD